MFVDTKLEYLQEQLDMLLESTKNRDKEKGIVSQVQEDRSAHTLMNSIDTQRQSYVTPGGHFNGNVDVELIVPSHQHKGSKLKQAS